MKLALASIVALFATVAMANGSAKEAAKPATAAAPAAHATKEDCSKMTGAAKTDCEKKSAEHGKTKTH